MGTLDHLSEHVATKIEANPTDDARRAWLLNRLWVEHPEATILIGAFSRYAEGAEPETDALVFTGPSGSGKTHQFTQFARIRSPTWTEKTRRYLPRQFVYVRAPPDGDIRDFLHQLAKTIEAPRQIGMSCARSIASIAERLTTIEVEGLCVDDVHHFGYSNNRGLIHALSVLRAIAELGHKTFLIGLDDMEDIIRSDEQGDSRYVFCRTKRWVLDNNYVSFLMSVARVLPLRKESFLSDEKIAKYLIKQTEGDNRRLFRMLIGAALRAIGGDESITLAGLRLFEPLPRRIQSRRM